MKPTNATVMCAGAVLALSLTLLPPLAAQGMPPEAREAIHTLLNRHEAITRKVEMTARGYVAVTESDDPEVVAALRRHVKQMEERLESGLRVRRWDPAFAEYVAHYRDIDHTFKATARGVRMTVKRRTPEAVQVAQNHARVVSEFKCGYLWFEILVVSKSAHMICDFPNQLPSPPISRIITCSSV